MKWSRAALLLVATLAAVSALAQTHPNLEKGFAADKMYQFGDVDHVNLFNGNLTLTVPLGAASPVAGKISIAPVLVYNSKLWDSNTVMDYSVPEQQKLVKTPTSTSNTGLGWQLSFGRLLEGSTTGGGLRADHDGDILTTNGFTYWSPDGGDHHFDASLHGEVDSADQHQYTHDGTYLRLTKVEAEQLCYVESPDGIVREFSSWTDGSRLRWRITKIRDALGNYLTFDYSTALQWTITDQFGRQTYVHFVAVSDGQVYSSTPAYQTYIDYVDVPAPATGEPPIVRRARYNFSYTFKWVDNGYCMSDGPSVKSGPYQYKLPILDAVTLPDGSGWQFTYNTAGDTANDASRGTCFGGVLLSATLPTRGVMSWTFAEYTLPTNACEVDAVAYSAGVGTRRLLDPVKGTDGTWIYDQSLSLEPPRTWTCPGTVPRSSVPDYQPAEQSTTTVTDPAGNVTKNYFSVWPGLTPLQGNGPSGTTYKDDFGLPYTKKSSLNGKYLSTESGDSAHLRKTYVKYERDASSAGVSALDTNRRLVGTATSYADDASTVVSTDYSDFDGVGHYRQETVSETSTGTAVGQRTTITDYNRQSALVGAGIPDTGTFPTSFTKPTGTWLLDLFTQTKVTEGGASGAKELCFDSATGFLKGSRTYAGSARGAYDLVAAFDSDATAANGANGAVTGERYYGGDAHPLTMGATATLCGALSAPGALEYEMRHTYDHGGRTTSEVYSGGTPFGLKLLDQDIDPSTGLVMHSRDAAGVQTDFEYDPSRRVTSAKTATDTAISYAYANATASQPATVTIRQGSDSDATAPAAEFRFDGLGRLFLHSSTLPPTSAGVFRWSRQATAYDNAGRKLSVSEWEESNAPSHLTVFNGYDAFGRVTSVVKPDQSTATTSYVGTREIRRTTPVRVSGTSDTNVTTTEQYDIHGRLTQVADAAATTSYTYDVGNHLSDVSMSSTTDGAQSRSFVYDNRGFLTQETHPENGTVTYTYDSRGHVLSKSLPAAPSAVQNLTYKYDAAERLTEVDSASPNNPPQTRVSKLFTFATDNVGGRRNGKLLTATRHNYHPSMGDVIVTDTYFYTADTGRVQKKQTNITQNGDVSMQKTFEQTYGYDSVGLPNQIVYPACTDTACMAANWGYVNFAHQNAMLTSIGGIASINYAGNGMLSKVTHRNGQLDGVVDTYEVNATNGMARPNSITFGSFAGCTVPTITTGPAPQQVNPGSASTLTVVASGPGLGYQWFDVSSGPISGANLSSYSTGPLTQTHSYYVVVTNACGKVTSSTATITVITCQTPSITTNPSSQQVSYGASVTLSVAASGTSPSYQWYDGGTAIAGATNTSYTTPAMTSTHRFTVNVTNACGSVTSSEATITVSSTAPSALVAQASGTAPVAITWAAGGSGTDHYEIERRSGQAAFAQIATRTTLSFTDDTAAANTAYLYRVRGVSVSGIASSYTNSDLATTVAFTAVAIGGTAAASPLNELLNAVNAIRALSGGAALTWSGILPVGDPAPQTGALIKASQLTALRTSMDGALNGAGMSSAAYSDIPPNGLAIRAIHIQELQTRTR